MGMFWIVEFVEIRIHVYGLHSLSLVMRTRQGWHLIFVVQCSVSLKLWFCPRKTAILPVNPTFLARFCKFSQRTKERCVQGPTRRSHKLRSRISLKQDVARFLA